MTCIQCRRFDIARPLASVDQGALKNLPTVSNVLNLQGAQLPQPTAGGVMVTGCQMRFQHLPDSMQLPGIQVRVYVKPVMR